LSWISTSAEALTVLSSVAASTAAMGKPERIRNKPVISPVTFHGNTAQTRPTPLVENEVGSRCARRHDVDCDVLLRT
jgi:hypothetical protein